MRIENTKTLLGFFLKKKKKKYFTKLCDKDIVDNKKFSGTDKSFFSEDTKSREKKTTLVIIANLVSIEFNVANGFNIFFKYTLFYVSNTFISNARLKFAKKNKQKLSNTLRLNFHSLKIIRFFHSRFHPEIIGDILKNVQKTRVSVLMTLYEITKMQNK